MLDELVGDPVNRWHPVRWLGVGLHRLEGCVYADSLGRGAIFFALALTPSLLLPPFLAPGGRLIETVGLWLTLGGRSLTREAEEVARLLELDDLVAARCQLRHLVGRDVEELGPDEIARAAIESVAENTTDAVVGPLLWYAVGGLSGAMGFRSINTLDAMVGHKSIRYQRFGFVSAKADDLAVGPASILGAFLCWTLSNKESRQRMVSAMASSHLHPSLNAGLIEAAFAGALGVQLGGVNSYHGRSVETPRFEVGSSPGVEAIRDASRLSRRVAWGSALVAMLAIVAAK
jgi:adenosylcobinamide-phosphate synthase